MRATRRLLQGKPAGLKRDPHRHPVLGAGDHQYVEATLRRGA
jgi:hypothetical protein